MDSYKGPAPTQFQFLGENLAGQPQTISYCATDASTSADRSNHPARRLLTNRMSFLQLRVKSNTTRAACGSGRAKWKEITITKRMSGK
jgi:hypothetical protein